MNSSNGIMKGRSVAETSPLEALPWKKELLSTLIMNCITVKPVNSSKPLVKKLQKSTNHTKKVEPTNQWSVSSVAVNSSLALKPHWEKQKPTRKLRFLSLLLKPMERKTSPRLKPSASTNSSVLFKTQIHFTSAPPSTSTTNKDTCLTLLLDVLELITTTLWLVRPSSTRSRLSRSLKERKTKSWLFLKPTLDTANSRSPLMEMI